MIRSHVLLWDVAEGKEIDHIDLGEVEDAGCSAAFASNGQSFAIGTAGSVVLRFALCQ